MLLLGLKDPFRGPFSILLEAMQLGAFEELLKEDIQNAANDSKSVGPPALLSFDRESRCPNYNAWNTIHFHLLTGSLLFDICVNY